VAFGEVQALVPDWADWSFHPLRESATELWGHTLAMHSKKGTGFSLEIWTSVNKVPGCARSQNRVTEHFSSKSAFKITPELAASYY
jgi:hypothetical protein